jgi:hypothetical protein
MIKVVEGELIRTLEDGELEQLICEVRTGYILILVKENGKLHEGYIFVEDGKIVGSYYTDNESTEIFGDEKYVIELLKCGNKVIELCRYTEDKLNLMKWLYPEVFEKNKKEDKKETKTKTKDIPKEQYLNIKLNIPLDNLLESDAKDFERYLKDGEYILINAYRKVDGVFENGYIIYRGRTPIAAAYERNIGVLLGRNACEKIKELLNDENSIIDVYGYDEKIVEVVLEIYPQMKLVKEEEKKVEKPKKAEDIIAEMMVIEEPKEIKEVKDEHIDDEKPPEEQEGLEKLDELSRDELLKKLGIKEPNDAWVETILEDVFRPSEDELGELKQKIEKEIVDKIKEIKGVGSVDTDINVKWENGRYYIFGDINIKRRRILGLIRKEVEPSLIKVEIDKIIKKYIPKSTSRISVNIE